MVRSLLRKVDIRGLSSGWDQTLSPCEHLPHFNLKKFSIQSPKAWWYSMKWFYSSGHQPSLGHNLSTSLGDEKRILRGSLVLFIISTKMPLSPLIHERHGHASGGWIGEVSGFPSYPV